MTTVAGSRCSKQPCAGLTTTNSSSAYMRRIPMVRADPLLKLRIPGRNEQLCSWSFQQDTELLRAEREDLSSAGKKESEVDLQRSSRRRDGSEGDRRPAGKNRQGPRVVDQADQE